MLNLVVRHKAVTDFGANAGDASGIFVLNATMAQLSRNQVTESRIPDDQSGSGVAGGIVALAVTPLTQISPSAVQKQLDVSTWERGVSLYQPGPDALRIEHNIVRVVNGQALDVAGLGAFSIVNNALSSSYSQPSAPPQLALTALILNFGAAVDMSGASKTFSGMYEAEPSGNLEDMQLALSSSGAVLFTDNRCTLYAQDAEGTFVGAQTTEALSRTQTASQRPQCSSAASTTRSSTTTIVGCWPHHRGRFSMYY